MNTHKFKAALEAIRVVSDIFATAAPTVDFQEWTPDTFQGWKSVHICNRYFGPHGQDGSMPFHPLVDPNDTLGALEKRGYRHTEDNDVGYFQRVKREDGRYTYV